MREKVSRYWRWDGDLLTRFDQGEQSLVCSLKFAFSRWKTGSARSLDCWTKKLTCGDLGILSENGEWLENENLETF